MTAHKRSYREVMEERPSEPTSNAAAHYRCRKHSTVMVTLFVPGIPSYTRCGHPLRCVGYATPQQSELFAEAAQ
jgi:hypothetical protein